MRYVLVYTCKIVSLCIIYLYAYVGIIYDICRMPCKSQELSKVYLILSKPVSMVYLISSKSISKVYLILSKPISKIYLISLKPVSTSFKVIFNFR